MVMNSLAMNLYVDCMPVDNLRPLDSEQVSRILLRAMNSRDLSANSSLDTSSLLQQYNLNHMRTLNQMTFVQLLSTQTKNMEELGCRSVDPTLLNHSTSIGSVSAEGPIRTGMNFEDMQRQFKFNSMWNKEESIHILLQSQELNLKVNDVSFFVKPDKTMKIEDFTLMQGGASIAMTQYFKETWINGVVQTIRVNLEDVHKGWFNIDEDNLEVYAFSKLKKFLYRLNYTMEDITRDLMMSTVADYVDTMTHFCPDKVSVESMVTCVVEGSKTYPLFAVDLKFIEGTADSPASFIYSNSPQQIFDAIMTPLDTSFGLIKGIVKAERRVMKVLLTTR
jgi:dynein heavy chain